MNPGDLTPEDLKTSMVEDKPGATPAEIPKAEIPPEEPAAIQSEHKSSRKTASKHSEHISQQAPKRVSPPKSEWSLVSEKDELRSKFSSVKSKQKEESI